MLIVTIPIVSEAVANIFMKPVMFGGSGNFLDQVIRQAMEIKSDEDGRMVW